MKMMVKTRERYFLMGISLGILLLSGVYQLTKAPLWFDETIEFYYSRSLVGVIPGSEDVSTMYERIVSTFQPPLYNVLMYFWLKISTSEWWFRFFSVVMGTVGGLGIFKAVEKIWNCRAAAVSVLIAACTTKYVYYMQEAAEYSLLLATLGWFVYTWIGLIEHPSWKRIAAYVIIACLSVYSQYGAVFPVIAFSVTAYVIFLCRKDRNTIIHISVGYAAAAVFAALPLWAFFLKQQLQYQQSDTLHAFDITTNIILDIFESLETVIDWMCSYCDRKCLIAALVVVFLVLIFTKDIIIRGLIISNTICWLLFYLLVKLSYYSYGSFGDRYCLFFAPIWISSIVCIAHESIVIVTAWLPTRFTSVVYEGILLVLSIAFCWTGWSVIRLNWTKEDIRGAAEAWYSAGGYDTTTLVYYASNTGFTYYVSEYLGCGDDVYGNVVYMEWYYDRTDDEYSNYFDKLLNGEWPDELYFVSSHMGDDYETMLDCFENNGYEQIIVYDSYRGKLTLLTQTS